MANLFKRPKSPYYYARFTYNGKEYVFSTECSTQKDANAALRNKLAKLRGETSLTAQFDDVVTRLESTEDEETRERMRQEFMSRLLQGTTDKLDLSDAWQVWFDNPKKRNPSAVTLKHYRGQWDRFQKWMTENHSALQYLHEITPAITEDYAADLWGSSVTPRTYNAHTNFLRSMFKVLRVRAGLSVNVWDEIPAMPKQQESKRNLTTNELAKVCSKATGNMRYWFAIGLYTGLRLGDVVTLRWDEVNLKEGFIERVPMKTRRTNKVVRFPIHPVLEVMLKELRKASPKNADYLFREDAELYQRDDSSISKTIQKHFKACSIKTHDKPNGSQRKMSIVRVGFHSLRHSFVSLCAANRVPQVAIMELVGHGSPAMTRLYSHMGDEQKSKAIAALPEVSFEDKS